MDHCCLPYYIIQLEINIHAKIFSFKKYTFLRLLEFVTLIHDGRVSWNDIWLPLFPFFSSYFCIQWKFTHEVQNVELFFLSIEGRQI